MVDVGDGIAAAIRIESHNHPSAIEPYQGAATGVGGILRDIFSMGARPDRGDGPVAVRPARRRPRPAGSPRGSCRASPATATPSASPRWAARRCSTRPTPDNPLVNVLCLGVMPVERLVLGRAEGVGNLAVLLGSTTGRDGIGGVSVLASAGFSDDEADADKRPSVQVGDPFEEKRLIEACLELLDRDLAVGVQDLGGAGITCATSETAAKGGAGMDVMVDTIPRREPGMEPFEVMTSESQERMLAIVEPSNLDAVLAIAERWEIRATVIGTVTDSGRLRVLDDDGGRGAGRRAGQVAGGRGPAVRPAPGRARGPGRAPGRLGRHPAGPGDAGADLVDLLCDTSGCRRSTTTCCSSTPWRDPAATPPCCGSSTPPPVWTPAGAWRSPPTATTCGARSTPGAGAAMTVAESVMNLAVVGARPLAMVNCMNFGNPEHPEVMWQLSESVDGLSEATRRVRHPLRGGQRQPVQRVAGPDIDPTPIIGVLGVIDRLDRRPPGIGLVDGGRLILVGGRRPRAVGLAVGRPTGPPRPGHAADRRPRRRRRGRPASCGSWSAPGLVQGAHDVAQGGVGAGGGRDGGRDPVWASRRPASRTTCELFSESSAGRCCAWRPTRCGPCSTSWRPTRCPTAASAPPGVTAWRSRTWSTSPWTSPWQLAATAPGAVGTGTTQG